MKKLIRTDMLNRYWVKLGIRVFLFVFFLVFYLRDKKVMLELVMQPIWMGITPIHVLWFIFMGIMLIHIFPTDRLSMALRKSKNRHYSERKDYSELELLQFVQEQNIRAWKVMLIWLSFNAVFGFLYLMKVINDADLLMLTVFYFLCDYPPLCSSWPSTPSWAATCKRPPAWATPTM